MRKKLFSAALAVALAACSMLQTVSAAPQQAADVAQAAQDDPVLAAILAKADADAAAKTADASAQAETPAPAIDAAAIAGDWQLAKVDATDAPYLYVDSTLHVTADGTVTIHQQFKNRDRTDDWTATVANAQDASGAWRFTHSMAAAGRMAMSKRSHWGMFSSVSGASMAPHIRARVMVS